MTYTINRFLAQTKRHGFKLHKRVSSSDDASAAVEFGLLVFPLTVILMGIVNFGYALFGMNQMQSISNEVIRAVSYGGLTQAEATLLATSKLQRFGGDTLVVDIDETDPNSRTITISGTTDKLTLVDFPFASLQYYQNDFTISANAPKFKMSSVAAGS